MPLLVKNLCKSKTMTLLLGIMLQLLLSIDTPPINIYIHIRPTMKVKGMKRLINIVDGP